MGQPKLANKYDITTVGQFPMLSMIELDDVMKREVDNKHFERLTVSFTNPSVASFHVAVRILYITFLEKNQFQM